ncbi:MAG: 3-deoxy-manno-octulosonate cytidylyltransferase [Bacteroidetes bacterium]|nr:3-deoxy-manno-octulosonate cytidylyltransferase [Bacteroidota bacterium]MCW5894710.1 3-deoxy-manno-octulosonate cytidylyltransferase [Bacteroidota bacterium]
MTNTVVIIPARYASQRLPAKPLADIGGKPMIRHVYERAAQATLATKVLVATDDRRIADAVEAFGGNAAMTPVDLQSGTDRVAFAARSISGSDIIVNVQGDEPLIASEMIDEGIRIVVESDAQVGTLVRKIEQEAELFNPNIVKVALGKNGTCLYFSRSPIPFGRDVAQKDWLKQTAYYKHIGLYVFRREFLLRYPTLPQTPLERAEKLEQLRILEHGYTIRAAVTEYDSVPVDTEDDLKRVRLVYQQQYERR